MLQCYGSSCDASLLAFLVPRPMPINFRVVASATMLVRLDEANVCLLDGCASVTFATRWAVIPHDKLWLSRSLSDVLQQPIHHARKLAERDQS